MINAVLSAIPNYYMACFLWPKESLEKLEWLLRAFLWQGKKIVHEGHCLVVWDKVIMPWECGGLALGILRLTI